MNIRIEPLETRIAPASFFVSSITTEVFTAAGVSAQDDTATVGDELDARDFFGVDRAVLLATGDKLIFDYNHNNLADGADLSLVSVTGGQALALLDDLDGDGHFDPNELVGLAVSDGFAATIKGDVSGTIITALTAGGLLSYTGAKLNLLDASIAGLTVTGNIGRDIVAGGSIANVKLGKSIYGRSQEPSVRDIITGTEANSQTFSFGAVDLDTNDFTPATGAAGGSITKVTLALGARELLAGNGGANGAGAGGVGGSISEITSLDGFGVAGFVAGAGGSSTGGAGGDGGSVTKVKIKTALHERSPDFDGGNGGDGGGANAGGKGGEVRDVQLSFIDANGDIDINGGEGGDGGATGSGGDGGAVVNASVKISGALVDSSLRVSGGLGGDAGAGGGTGGKGGGVIALNATFGTVDGLTIEGGAGGAGGAGAAGAGGEISGLKFAARVQGGNSMIKAGLGGGSTGGAGGAGGAFSGNAIKIGYASFFMEIGAGQGGDGGGSGDGGAGGELTKPAITIGSHADGAMNVFAGHGGLGGATGGKGGKGGDFLGGAVTITGFSAEDLKISSGEGGVGGAGTGPGDGGAAGRIADLKVSVFDSDANVTLQAGLGGGSGVGGGKGGDGGAVERVTVTSAHFIDDGVNVFSGIGGGANAGSDGGAGGALAKVKVKLVTIGSGGVSVRSGRGGGTLGSGKGGDGGDATGIDVSVATSLGPITLSAGRGGDSGTGAGGAGGELTQSKFAVIRLFDSDAELHSGSGGNSGGAGAGGAGGLLARVSAKIGAPSEGVFLFFEAGSGGESDSGTGGAGGAVQMVKATSSAQGEYDVSAGNGGKVTSGAGAAGDGGGLTDITLTVSGSTENADFQGGSGGTHDGTGTGGDGGSFERVKVTQLHSLVSGDSASQFYFSPGSGGNSAGGAGGAGGGITTLTLTKEYKGTGLLSKRMLTRCRESGLDAAMRRPRFKAPPEHPLAYYHCISRVVDRQFVFGPQEKEQFVEFMRLYARFCGVRVVTYCVMSNHFHVLVEVPQRPTELPDDGALLKEVSAVYRGSGGAGAIRQHLAFLRKEEAHAEAEAYRETFFARMWDVSAFMKLLKQRFTQWFNRTRGRKGTLWEERFKSVLVEGAGTALATMAAYIDMNPMRAGLVGDPKEYRWCGYAAAVAAVKEARAGLLIVAEAACGQAVTAKDILREYRMLLYGTGEEEGLDEQGRPLRRGFTRAEVEAVVSSKGRLERWQMLRCRVRYFSDGAALAACRA